MAFVLLVVCFVVWLVADWKEHKRVEAVVEDQRARGWCDPTDFDFARRFMQDMERNWNEGDKSMYPEEYIPYFKEDAAHGGNALSKYIVYRCWHEEMQKGLCPAYMPAWYDKRTFRPLEAYKETSAGKNIETYNETGVYYKTTT